MPLRRTGDAPSDSDPDAWRRRLVSRLAGPVVEVGAGAGLTFAHYPPDVTEVVAIEPDPQARAAARRAAHGAPVPVEVVGCSVPSRRSTRACPTRPDACPAGPAGIPGP